MASATLSPKNPALRIAKVRETLERGYYDAPRIDGVRLDSFSASAIIAVYDALDNQEAKDRFASLPIHQMVGVAFKMVQKHGSVGSGRHKHDGHCRCASAAQRRGGRR